MNENSMDLITGASILHALVADVNRLYEMQEQAHNRMIQAEENQQKKLEAIEATLQMLSLNLQGTSEERQEEKQMLKAESKRRLLQCQEETNLQKENEEEESIITKTSNPIEYNDDLHSFEQEAAPTKEEIVQDIKIALTKKSVRFLEEKEIIPKEKRPSYIRARKRWQWAYRQIRIRRIFQRVPWTLAVSAKNRSVAYRLTKTEEDLDAAKFRIARLEELLEQSCENSKAIDTKNKATFKKIQHEQQLSRQRAEKSNNHISTELDEIRSELENIGADDSCHARPNQEDDQDWLAVRAVASQVRCSLDDQVLDKATPLLRQELEAVKTALEPVVQSTFQDTNQRRKSVLDAAKVMHGIIQSDHHEALTKLAVNQDEEACSLLIFGRSAMAQAAGGALLSETWELAENTANRLEMLEQSLCQATTQYKTENQIALSRIEDAERRQFKKHISIQEQLLSLQKENEQNSLAETYRRDREEMKKVAAIAHRATDDLNSFKNVMTDISLNISAVSNRLDQEQHTQRNLVASLREEITSLAESQREGLAQAKIDKNRLTQLAERLGDIPAASRCLSCNRPYKCTHPPPELSQKTATKDNHDDTKEEYPENDKSPKQQTSAVQIKHHLLLPRPATAFGSLSSTTTKKSPLSDQQRILYTSQARFIPTSKRNQLLSAHR